ncbi:ABC transporter transmembrane domain-containing protein [Chthonobacter albigriseus]|uniref:ABC transporter transmembrane domain-containing protein n=1 Tax=Chthonobacter albigriseus TaxID=1683161 RepID=UPI0015EFCE66
MGIPNRPNDPARFGRRSVAGQTTVIRRVIRLVRDTVSGLSPVVILGSIAVNLLSLVLPLATLQIYDRIIPQRALDTLSLLLIGVVVVAACESVLRIARTNLITWSATQLAWKVQSEALGRILAAPQAWVDSEPPSRILERLQALTAVSEWQASPSRLVLVDLPFVPIYLIVLGVVGHWLVLVPIVLFVLLGSIGASRGSQLRRVVEARSFEDLKIRDFLIETLTGIGTIKAHAMEPQMVRRFERLQETAARCTSETIRISDDAQSFASLSSTLTQVVMVSIGAVLAITDGLSIGTLACCTMLAGWSLQPLLRAVSLLSELQSLMVAEGKAEPLISLPAVRPRITPLPLRREPAAVSFRAVSLNRMRPGASPLGIEQFDFNPGEIVALTGPDGSGKSTLAELAAGMLLPDSGQILLDGEDIHLDPERLVTRVAFVTQRQATVRGTVLENITMFRPDATDVALESCRLIGLERDINLLPFGYESRMADGIGEQFSGGFLQRVAIARAIARRPGFLILDEVNTSLDMAADRALAAGLAQLRGTTTILLVTNRPSMASIADRLVTMDHGRIAKVTASDAARPVAAGVGA